MEFISNSFRWIANKHSCHFQMDCANILFMNNGNSVALNTICVWFRYKTWKKCLMHLAGPLDCDICRNRWWFMRKKLRGSVINCYNKKLSDKQLRDRVSDVYRSTFRCDELAAVLCWVKTTTWHTITRGWFSSWILKCIIIIICRWNHWKA